MIESIRIEDDGPDGTYLVIDGDEFLGKYAAAGDARIFQVNDDVLRQLDAALQPFRDHWAEGDAVRHEFEAHRGAGFCTGWVAGRGPCLLRYGHEGPHSRRMILEEGEEV